jgi:hypothetical protein
MAMTFVTGDGDGFEARKQDLSEANDVGGLRVLCTAQDKAADIWRSWALNNGGTVISTGLDSFCLEVPADVLDQLPALVDQYRLSTGFTITVGVGMVLRQAAVALAWGKLNGGARISFYEESMDQQLAEAAKAGEDTELSPQSCLEKANTGMPGVFRGDVHTGIKYPKHQQAPQFGTQSAKQDDKVPAPEHTHAAADYERHFRHLAHKQGQQDVAQASMAKAPTQDDVKQTVVDVLKQIKNAAPTLDAIREQAPDVYKAVQATIKAMIDMAKQLTGQPEPIAKSQSGKICPKCSSEKVLGDWGRLFCTECKHSGPADDFGSDLDKTALPMPRNKPMTIPDSPVGSLEDGKLKITHSDGSTGWTNIRSGIARSTTDDHAVSAAKPNTP